MTSNKNSSKQNGANVFQIMMDARNKSIGTNSPGEERVHRTENSILKDQNKELLAKRKIKFEAWAAEKGGTKRKLKEEAIDMQIKDELDKRAKRLKKLILNQNKKSASEGQLNLEKDLHDKSVKAKRKRHIDKKTKPNSCSNFNSNGAFENLVEIEEQISDHSVSIDKSNSKSSTVQENIDYGFLSNLNPSLKKSQNLLSYFGKVSPEIVKPSSPIASNKSLLKSPKWKVRLSLNVASEDNDENLLNISDDDVEVIDIENGNNVDIEESVTEKKMAPLFMKVNQSKVPKVTNGSLLKKLDLINMKPRFQYPKISHVYQKTELNIWNLSKTTDLGLFQIRSDNESMIDMIPKNNLLSVGLFTYCKRSQFLYDNKKLNVLDVSERPVLETRSNIIKLKRRYPDFPVYRTYNLLKNKFCLQVDVNDDKEYKMKKKSNKSKKKTLEEKKTSLTTFDGTNINNMSWCDMFCPNNSQELITVNRESSDLKKWLGQWKEFNDMKSRKNYDSDASSYNSDTEFLQNDSYTNFKALKNTAVLLGPSGSGKTITVYSLAHELGYNVIELNASSKRTGKIAFTKLQEATQSYGVRDKDSKLQFLEETSDNNKKKKSKHKLEKQLLKCNHEKSLSKNLSLILIEDVDVVFDEDDGLISALFQIVQMSKRPIVFTCSDENNANVKKFICDNLVIRFKPPNLTTTSIWLQILCLVHNIYAEKLVLDQLLESYNGDIRKALHKLQYWVLTGGDPKATCLSLQHSVNKVQTASDSIELYSDDSSNLSFSSDLEDQNEIYHSKFLLCVCTDKIAEANCHMYSLDNLWLYITPDKLLSGSSTTQSNEDIPLKKYVELVKFLDSTSYADVLEKLRNKLQFQEEETYFALENFKMYILREMYLKANVDPHVHDISIEHYKRLYSEVRQTNKKLEKAVCERNSIMKKAFTLDYGPTLRAMCRAEKERSETTLKRATSNRFYHYFRTLDVELTKDVQNSLSNYLC